MTKRWQTHFRSILTGAIITSLSCVPGIAGAATEAEPNDAQPDAQVLLIPAEGMSVSPMMGVGGSTTTDMDIYAFNADAGDVPVIMVVTDGSWDSLLVLYDSSGAILDMNDDAYPMNPGSVSPLDSRIDMYRINAPGTYYAVVTPIPRFLDVNFTPIFPDPGASGSYTLMASGVTSTTPPPVVVEDDPVIVEEDPVVTEKDDEFEAFDDVSDPYVATIQVKNWRGKVGDKGKKHGIPVAILSGPDFDALSVDKSSLTFGATGDEQSFMNCRKKGKDVKVDKVKDGIKDLVCYFNPEATGLTENDVQGIVRGKWVDSEGLVREFEGSAALSVIIVSNKKGESWHVRHGVDPRDKKYKELKRGKKHGKHGKKKHEKHSKLD